MKRFKFPLFIIALLLALVTTFAFTQNSEPKEKVFTQYHFEGPYTDLGVANPSNWIAESTSECLENGDLPCGITYSGTRQDFDIMVSGFNNVAEATAACDKRFD